MNQITVAELHQRLSENKNLHVIDVREQEEYDANNIGALLLPLSRLRNMNADAIESWKDEEIIVHCRSGHRSMEACMLLQTLGFSRPVNLAGGIMAWQEQYGDQRIK